MLRLAKKKKKMIKNQIAICSYLVDLSPFLRGLVGEPLVNHGHDLIEQLTERSISFGA